MHPHVTELACGRQAPPSEAISRVPASVCLWGRGFPGPPVRPQGGQSPPSPTTSRVSRLGRTGRGARGRQKIILGRHVPPWAWGGSEISVWLSGHLAAAVNSVSEATSFSATVCEGLWRGPPSRHPSALCSARPVPDLLLQRLIPGSCFSLENKI